MKKLFVIGLLFICTVSHASWKLVTIFNNETPVGYIYYTSAIGTITGPSKSKVATRLQFICSLKGGEPIISIMWDKTAFSSANVTVSHVVDDNSLDFSYWVTDGNLIYKSASTSPATIQTLKYGRVVKFQLQGPNNTHYKTMFSISDINLTDFNTKCNTQL